MRRERSAPGGEASTGATEHRGGATGGLPRVGLPGRCVSERKAGGFPALRMQLGPPLPQGSRSGSSNDASRGRELRPLVQTWQNLRECGMEGEDWEKATSVPSTTPTSAGRPPATMRPRERPGPQAHRAPGRQGQARLQWPLLRCGPTPLSKECDTRQSPSLQFEVAPLSHAGTGPASGPGKSVA